MGGPDGQICRSCYYYMPEIEPLGAGYDCGTCHRFPPSEKLADEQSEILMHRIVHHDTWCGEFRQKGTAPLYTIPKLSLEAAQAVVRRVTDHAQHTATATSVYVGTRYGHRHLIRREHDLSGCDHITIGWVDRETEAALAADGIEIR